MISWMLRRRVHVATVGPRKDHAMVASTPNTVDMALNLTLAVIASSNSPLLLLDGELTVLAASASFCRAFGFSPDKVAGRQMLELGAGEWNAPQLQSLLQATA